MLVCRKHRPLALPVIHIQSQHSNTILSHSPSMIYSRGNVLQPFNRCTLLNRHIIAFTWPDVYLPNAVYTTPIKNYIKNCFSVVRYAPVLGARSLLRLGEASSNKINGDQGPFPHSDNKEKKYAKHQTLKY